MIIRSSLVSKILSFATIIVFLSCLLQLLNQQITFSVAQSEPLIERFFYCNSSSTTSLNVPVQASSEIVIIVVVGPGCASVSVRSSVAHSLTVKGTSFEDIRFMFQRVTLSKVNGPKILISPDNRSENITECGVHVRDIQIIDASSNKNDLIILQVGADDDNDIDERDGVVSAFNSPETVMKRGVIRGLSSQVTIVRVTVSVENVDREFTALRLKMNVVSAEMIIVQSVLAQFRCLESISSPTKSWNITAIDASSVDMANVTRGVLVQQATFSTTNPVYLDQSSSPDADIEIVPLKLKSVRHMPQVKVEFSSFNFSFASAFASPGSSTPRRITFIGMKVAESVDDCERVSVNLGQVDLHLNLTDPSSSSNSVNFIGNFHLIWVERASRVANLALGSAQLNIISVGYGGDGGGEVTTSSPSDVFGRRDAREMEQELTSSSTPTTFIKAQATLIHVVHVKESYFLLALSSLTHTIVSHEDQLSSSRSLPLPENFKSSISALRLENGLQHNEPPFLLDNSYIEIGLVTLRADQYDGDITANLLTSFGEINNASHILVQQCLLEAKIGGVRNHDISALAFDTNDEKSTLKNVGFIVLDHNVISIPSRSSSSSSHHYLYGERKVSLATFSNIHYDSNVVVSQAARISNASQLLYASITGEKHNPCRNRSSCAFFQNNSILLSMKYTTRGVDQEYTGESVISHLKVKSINMNFSEELDYYQQQEFLAPLFVVTDSMTKIDKLEDDRYRVVGLSAVSFVSSSTSSSSSSNILAFRVHNFIFQTTSTHNKSSSDVNSEFSLQASNANSLDISFIHIDHNISNVFGGFVVSDCAIRLSESRICSDEETLVSALRVGKPSLEHADGDQEDESASLLFSAVDLRNISNITLTKNVIEWNPTEVEPLRSIECYNDFLRISLFQSSARTQIDQLRLLSVDANTLLLHNDDPEMISFDSSLVRIHTLVTSSFLPNSHSIETMQIFNNSVQLSKTSSFPSILGVSELSFVFSSLKLDYLVFESSSSSSHPPNHHHSSNSQSLISFLNNTFDLLQYDSNSTPGEDIRIINGLYLVDGTAVSREQILSAPKNLNISIQNCSIHIHQTDENTLLQEANLTFSFFSATRYSDFSDPTNSLQLQNNKIIVDPEIQLFANITANLMWISDQFWFPLMNHQQKVVLAENFTIQMPDIIISQHATRRLRLSVIHVDFFSVRSTSSSTVSGFPVSNSNPLLSSSQRQRTFISILNTNMRLSIFNQTFEDRNISALRKDSSLFWFDGFPIDVSVIFFQGHRLAQNVSFVVNTSNLSLSIDGMRQPRNFLHLSVVKLGTTEGAQTFRVYSYHHDDDDWFDFDISNFTLRFQFGNEGFLTFRNSVAPILLRDAGLENAKIRLFGGDSQVVFSERSLIKMQAQTFELVFCGVGLHLGRKSFVNNSIEASHITVKLKTSSLGDLQYAHDQQMQQQHRNLSKLVPTRGSASILVTALGASDRYFHSHFVPRSLKLSFVDIVCEGIESERFASSYLSMSIIYVATMRGGVGFTSTVLDRIRSPPATNALISINNCRQRLLITPTTIKGSNLGSAVVLCPLVTFDSSVSLSDNSLNLLSLVNSSTEIIDSSELQLLQDRNLTYIDGTFLLKNAVLRLVRLNALSFGSIFGADKMLKFGLTGRHGDCLSPRNPPNVLIAGGVQVICTSRMACLIPSRSQDYNSAPNQNFMRLPTRFNFAPGKDAAPFFKILIDYSLSQLPNTVVSSRDSTLLSVILQPTHDVESPTGLCFVVDGFDFSHRSLILHSPHLFPTFIINTPTSNSSQLPSQQSPSPADRYYVSPLYRSPSDFDSSKSESEILFLNQTIWRFLGSCSNSKNIFRNKMSLLNFRTDIVTKKLRSVYFECDTQRAISISRTLSDGNVTTSPSVSRRTPSSSLSISDNLSTNTAELSPSLTQQTPSKTSSTSLPVERIFTLPAPSTAQLVAESTVAVSSIFAVPSDAASVARTLVALSLARGCPDPKIEVKPEKSEAENKNILQKKLDGNYTREDEERDAPTMVSAYFIQPIPFPLSLFPGFEIDSSRPGGYLRASLLSWTVPLFVAVVAAFAVGVRSSRKRNEYFQTIEPKREVITKIKRDKNNNNTQNSNNDTSRDDGKNDQSTLPPEDPALLLPKKENLTLLDEMIDGNPEAIEAYKKRVEHQRGPYYNYTSVLDAAPILDWTTRILGLGVGNFGFVIGVLLTADVFDHGVVSGIMFLLFIIGIVITCAIYIGRVIQNRPGRPLVAATTLFFRDESAIDRGGDLTLSSLKEKLRTFLTLSPIAAFLFVGKFGWVAPQRKVKKDPTMSLPPAGPLAQLGKVLHAMWGPRLKSNQQDVDRRIFFLIAPFYGCLSILLNVLAVVVSGAAKQRPEYCDAARWLNFGIGFFLFLFVVIFRPLIVPAKLIMAILISFASFIVSILSLPGVLENKEEHLQRFEMITPTVMSVLILISLARKAVAVGLNIAAGENVKISKDALKTFHREKQQQQQQEEEMMKVPSSAKTITTKRKKFTFDDAPNLDTLLSGDTADYENLLSPAGFQPNNTNNHDRERRKRSKSRRRREGNESADIKRLSEYYDL